MDYKCHKKRKTCILFWETRFAK